MSDPQEIIHRGRRYVVRTSTVGGRCITTSAHTPDTTRSRKT